MDELKEQLYYQKKNGYDLIDTQERLALEEYCKLYMDYLDNSRTEREAVKNAIAMAKKHGFVEYKPGMGLKCGTKIYYNNRGKALILAVMGKKSLDEGTIIAGAHVDAPRLDIKQIPLYEAGSAEMAYLKTHYYGGIKKYQWVTLPLELHGVVCLKNGEKVEVVLGREKDEPKFIITDLLPHLAADQMKKTMAEGITGEGLNVLIGTTPYAGEGSSRVKLAIMSILNDMYGMTEEDFLSAELVAVPAYDVCEIGLDRSLIGGYGHDDRVCAFAEMHALFSVENPEKTCVCLLADKEEIGSMGVSGMQSQAFDAFMEELCEATGAKLRRCFANSFCLSADVCNAFDPLYAEVSESESSNKVNSNAKLNYGVGICKFTGARGKSSTSDASAEVVSHVRTLFAANNVLWQLTELGKVDQGGGGTIAQYMANRNIDTIDAGVPVLSMHAPFEVVSKLDCYMTFKAMLAAYNEK